MLKQKIALIGGITSLGLMFGLISSRAVAQMPHDMNEMRSPQADQAGQFRRIEQPVGHKAVVTLSGLGLIGLELWWFLLSKPKSRKAAAQGGVLEAPVTADGGYEPESKGE